MNSHESTMDLLCILIIENDTVDLARIEHVLEESANIKFNIDVASSADIAHMKLRDEIYDAVLVADEIDGWTGVELVKTLDQSDPFVPPMILLAKEESREADLAAQGAGFSDYLVKTQLTPPLLERAIRFGLERKQTEQNLVKLAYYDSLTGLPNRASFKTELTSRIADIKFVEGSFSLMLLDLDHFKDVNDTLGHPVGDLLLQAVSQRLSSSVEEGDFIARLGGDEFIVCTRPGRSRVETDAFADEIVTSLGAIYNLDGHEIRTATSIGIAIYPDDGRSYPELLKHADQALYRAKDAGRGTYIFFDQELLPS